MHPSDGTLRRSLDEPVAFDASKRQHVGTCARCTDRLRQMSSDAERAKTTLMSTDPVVDVSAARVRLAQTEAAAQDSAGRRRPASPVRTRTSRMSRVIGAVAVAAAASALVVVTGGAQDFLSLFQPKQFAAVTVTSADIRSLAGLASYGSVSTGPSLAIQAEPDAASADRAAGLNVPVVGDLPAGTPAPRYAVISGGVVAFSFNADLARAAAARAGGHLPPMPAGLDGSTLSVSIAPSVVVSYGLDLAATLQGGSPPTGQAFVVVATRTPTVSSTGVTAKQLEDYLLSLPGVPASVAAEIHAIGDPTRTIPVPIPVDLGSGAAVDINGAHGLVIGDSTGIGSIVLWQHNGIVDAVAGTLTTDQVLGIARAMH